MELIKVLNDKGGVHVKDILEQPLIDRATVVINSLLMEKNKVDVLVTPDGSVRKICYAFEKDGVFLDIISHPKVIQMLKEIYGADVSKILPSWEDILIKEPQTGIPVEIHQDLGLQSVQNGAVYSLAFHFHDSAENPVCFFEGSQKMGPITREDVKKYKEKALYTPYKSAAGDVDIHNVFTLHYSEANLVSNPRFTWYVEFRTLDQIIHDSAWDEDWALDRQAILHHAIENRKNKGLEYESIPFSRLEELEKRTLNVKLRIPHITETIQYTDNEYNHFADHKTLF